MSNRKNLENSEKNTLQRLYLKEIAFLRKDTKFIIWNNEVYIIFSVCAGKYYAYDNTCKAQEEGKKWISGIRLAVAQYIKLLNEHLTDLENLSIASAKNYKTQVRKRRNQLQTYSDILQNENLFNSKDGRFNLRLEIYNSYMKYITPDSNFFLILPSLEFADHFQLKYEKLGNFDMRGKKIGNKEIRIQGHSSSVPKYEGDSYAQKLRDYLAGTIQNWQDYYRAAST